MARPRAWADTVFANTITPTQLNSDLLLSVQQADTITAVRIVGHLKFVADEDPTAGLTLQSLSMGIQVVTGEALIANAVPDPNTSADTPARGWLWRDRLAEWTDFTNNLYQGAFFFPEVQFDVRSMRKVDRGKLIFTLNKIVTLGVAHDMQMIGIIRVLCLT